MHLVCVHMTIYTADVSHGIKLFQTPFTINILIQIEVFLKPLNGAVVLTFGAGNGPDKSKDIIEVFTEASKDTLMLNITQCLKGRVVDDYATGSVSKLLLPCHLL